MLNDAAYITKGLHNGDPNIPALTDLHWVHFQIRMDNDAAILKLPGRESLLEPAAPGVITLAGTTTRKASER